MHPCSVLHSSCPVSKPWQQCSALVSVLLVWPRHTSRHAACDTTAGDDDAQALEFRIIDYGHARLAKNKALAKLPKAPGLELSYRK